MSKIIYILFIAFFIPTHSWAVSNNIKEMCIDDYLAFCNQFDVGTPELTTCMRNSIDQLSEDCRNALKSEGYKKETESPDESNKNTVVNPVTQPVAQEERKEKSNVQQKTVKASSKPKQSFRLKTAIQPGKPKAATTKAKETVVTYPKRLDIPQSVGSSISVYGSY